MSTTKTTIECSNAQPRRRPRRLAGAASAAVLLSAICATQALSAEPPSIDAFASKTTAGVVELGPEGRSLSFLSREFAPTCWNDKLERKPVKRCKADDIRQAATDKVMVVDLATMKPIKAVPIPDDHIVNWMEWTSPDNLLLSITTRPRRARRDRRTGTNIASYGYLRPSARILSIPMDDTREPVVLFGDSKGVMRNNRNLGRVVDLLHDDPDHVVMGAYRGDDYDLFRVNVNTGSAERVAKGRGMTWGWFTDQQGRPSVRIDCTDYDCDKVKAYRPEDGADPNDESTKWIKFRTYDYRRRGGSGSKRVMDIEWVAPSDDPDVYYVEVEGETLPTRGIYKYNIRTNEIVETVFSDPDYDVGWTVIDPETGRYAGAAMWRDRLEYHLEDRRLQKHLDAINAYFDDRWNITMQGFSNDRGLAVFWATAPHDPGGYYLYDFAKARVEPLLRSNKALPPEFDARTETVRVPTRDGQTVTAYHTVPGQSVTGGSAAPLIVYVHGGPEARDVMDFDRDVQFLASRGYQVLQVNFRGSSGFGREHAEAGYRQWGKRMHTDVMDAVALLHRRGAATPDTTCIMGHSYGGYEALYAGAVEADSFACVVAGSGPSDLRASLKQDRDAHGANSGAFAYWTKSIGKLGVDDAAIKSASPIHHVARFDDPVLLIHGEDDDVVQYSHSEEMEAALRGAGKDVTLLSLEEGHYHNRWDIESRAEYYRTLESFLAGVFPEGGEAASTDAQP